MISTLGRAFKNADVRKRLLFMLGILIVVRLGSLIPIPGVNTGYFSSLLSSLGDGNLSYLNAFTGGSFERLSLFALGITPYITSSIIVQLLTIAIPKLEEMQREGEDGRKKMERITRFITLGLAIAESVAMAVGFGRQGLIAGYETMSMGHYVMAIIIVIIALIVGATALMWLGEQITDKGVGNGISIILLFNIIAGVPGDLAGLFDQFIKGKEAGHVVAAVAIIGGVILGMILLVCLLSDAERRIPVQYSQKVVGRRVFGGQSSHIPLKVNTAGVMPVIFASSIIQFPVIITQLITRSQPEWTKYLTASYWFNPDNWIYTIGLAAYVGLIIAFAYFYTSITFNPLEIADNLKRGGGVIPGVTPGKATSDYLHAILNRIIIVGAIGIAIVAIIPIIFSGIFGASVSFGGTSLIIIVGVILETLKQMEAMMRNKHYKGFLSDDN